MLVVLLISLNYLSVFARSERVIYAFAGYPDCGNLSTAPLVSDSDGNLYGTTLDGGTDKQGCVFELSRDTEGKWTEVIIHSFSGVDGRAPAAALTLDKFGDLYGTTEGGGIYGGGTAFRLRRSTDGEWAESVLYNFGNSNDGFGPQCQLVFDVAGNLYGTTLSGGNRRGSLQGGTVFKLSPTSEGWAETILYSFPGRIAGPNGTGPVGGIVIDGEGNLYGVTGFGGVNGAGAVYELRLKDGVYRERVIHSFSGYDGLQPSSNLVMNATGDLYGTTLFGGGSAACPVVGCGLVFKLTKAAGGSWAETILISLNGTDGYLAVGPPVLDHDGNVYAAALSGGIDANGSVYELSPAASGVWRETILHRFEFRFPNGVDGSRPYAGVILNQGQLFGTTASGGIHNEGTVFRISLPSHARYNK